jgi:hypothetical protein
MENNNNSMQAFRNVKTKTKSSVTGIEVEEEHTIKTETILPGSGGLYFICYL